MDGPSTIENGGILLDTFGQQTLPIYTQICFGFPLTDAQSYSSVIDNLASASRKLYAEFPWLAGRVVNEGATESSSGLFKIKPRPRGEEARLIVKDRRYDASFPSMGTLREDRFPINALDEDLLAPRRTLMEAGCSAEVFLVQATMIPGGLFLTFLGHHQAMDGIGQDQVIRLFAKACRGEDFTEEERVVGNLDAGNNIPLLEGFSELPSSILDHQIISKQKSLLQSQPQKPPDCSWATFSFNKTSLAALKTTATQGLPAGQFISTDDALSAFIWNSVTSVRLPRLSAGKSSTFARAVDVRHILAISPMHPGFVQNMTYNTLAFQELVEMPLGVLASQLRSRVDHETSTLARDTCALATFLSNTSDKCCVSFATSIKGGEDVFFSSWAKMRCYEYEFGSRLGTAEVVRRTKSNNLTEGLMYLMPRAPDGGIGLVVCLSDVDLAALRGEEEFARFAEYIG